MKKDVRYHWNVTIAGTNGSKESGVYRSRHATAQGVMTEFAKSGQKILKVTKA